MKVGVDGSKLPRAAQLGPIGVLERARALGLDGVFFRSVLAMSPALDPGLLRAIRQRADELSLYLETGVGNVNPYATAESPEIRAIGDGDYQLGLARQIRACEAIGCTELWVGTASYKRAYPGYFAYDRFRTDAPWAEQLAATARFLTTLVPLLRDLGCRLNVETHEEITTVEVLRLIDEVGSEALGVTLDAANVLARAEDPVAAVRRVAPYVHLTHLKDALLTYTADGLERHLRPCGEGIIDWPAILLLLGEHAPDLHLSIENPTTTGTLGIQCFDPVWQAAHPDLTVAELAEVFRLAHLSRSRLAEPSGSLMGGGEPMPLSEVEQLEFIQRSAAYLRDLLQHQRRSAEP
jgi:sugar phosphate isomerase/epimerase